MNKVEFNNFFEMYSKNVDRAEQVPFWDLSDLLVEEILKEYASQVPEGGVILDAGGGTGRWIIKLAKHTKAKFILYDLSTDMLSVAKKNIEKANLSDRVKIINGDLCDIQNVSKDGVDFIYSNYGVVSFVEDAQKMFNGLYRILKPNGFCSIMGHGYFNALFSKTCNMGVGMEELEDMFNDASVKWAEYVPKLKTFSQEHFEVLMKNAGFEFQKAYGIPAVIQPGPEDFDPTNTLRSNISKSLEKQEFFDKIFEIEKKVNQQPTVVNRGVNIIAIGKK